MLKFVTVWLAEVTPNNCVTVHIKFVTHYVTSHHSNWQYTNNI